MINSLIAVNSIGSHKAVDIIISVSLWDYIVSLKIPETPVYYSDSLSLLFSDRDLHYEFVAIKIHFLLNLVLNVKGEGLA